MWRLVPIQDGVTRGVGLLFVPISLALVHESGPGGLPAAGAC